MCLILMLGSLLCSLTPLSYVSNINGGQPLMFINTTIFSCFFQYYSLATAGERTTLSLHLTYFICRFGKKTVDTLQPLQNGKCLISSQLSSPFSVSQKSLIQLSYPYPISVYVLDIVELVLVRNMHELFAPGF